MDVNLALKKMVEDYFFKFPTLSLNALAKRANVSEPTLRRITSSQSKLPPAPNIVLNLVSYIKKEKRLAVLLKKTEGVIGEFLRENFSQFIFENETYQYDGDLNELFADKDMYLIYKLASNVVGVSKTEIRQILGEIGVIKLNKMVEQKVIISNNDDCFHSSNKNFSVDIEIAKNFLPHLVQFFKPESVALGLNLMYSLSESLNEDAIKKIKEIQKEAVKSIHEIMSNQNFHGDIPYFSLTMSDTLTIGDNL